MRQAQDLVWNMITESAKRRFDYAQFESSLSRLGDERTAEYILFQIVVGIAEGISADELLTKVSGDLLLFGCPVSDEDLNVFLSGKDKILKEEIHAAKEALSTFERGIDADTVFMHVRSLLLSPEDSASNPL